MHDKSPLYYVISAQKHAQGFIHDFFLGWKEFKKEGDHTQQNICLTTPTFAETHLIKNRLRSRISDINLGRLIGADLCEWENVPYQLQLIITSFIEVENVNKPNSKTICRVLMIFFPEMQLHLLGQQTTVYF